MDDTTATGEDGRAARKPRRDSVRNRERLLAAAKTVFGATDASGTVEAVAREAGVGIGTLYRHFPTRQALFEAVYRREVDQLVALAERLGGELPPLAALRAWMHANVAFVATKKGMSSALATAVQDASDLKTTTVDRLSAAADMLLRRAAEAGAIRADIGADDILRTIIGLCTVHDRPGWQSSALRLLDVFVAGLQHAPEPAAPQAPDRLAG